MTALFSQLKDKLHRLVGSVAPQGSEIRFVNTSLPRLKCLHDSNYKPLRLFLWVLGQTIMNAVMCALTETLLHDQHLVWSESHTSLWLTTVCASENKHITLLL